MTTGGWRHDRADMSGRPAKVPLIAAAGGKDVSSRPANSAPNSRWLAGDSSSYVAGRPQHLALERGPMSQDRLSNLFPSRVTEEAVPPTPTVVTMPQVTVAPSAPHPGLTDVGQSTLTPDR
ncbi:hypothetical protein BHM03_00042604 [Ensete ventricosum]|nr:hypothetical protein BHM03_00042604 [Ensete ventricosum]